MPREPHNVNAIHKSEVTMNDKYADIIGLHYTGVMNHPRMSLYSRAAQFAPFAALNGHDEAIDETARHTDARIELSTDEQKKLSADLSHAIETKAEITVTYFKPDPLKQGGAYISAHGRIKKIDEYDKTLLLADGLAIPLEDIFLIKKCGETITSRHTS